MDNTNENMTEDKNINKNNNGNSDDYEKICFVCRRPESRAGKMIVMPNNIYICQDCMQRTFDSINSSGMNYVKHAWNGHVWQFWRYGFRPGSRKAEA